MNRRSMLIPLAALAAAVGASPASAAGGNGWSCISPFAQYTNSAYPDAPPAPNHIVDSLAVTLTRTDASPLTAVPGQALALRDLQLQLVFTDTRVAEQMYKRSGGATASYQGIPRGQEEDNVRTFSQRANPNAGNVLYWAYNTAAQGQTANWVYTTPVSAGLPQMRLPDEPKDTANYYTANPTLGLAHRYLSRTGNSQFPLDAWVTIAASNTVEGFQTVHVRSYWQINIKDSTPGTPGNPARYADNDVTATIDPVVADLPRTNWTPTGAGPVDFTVAAPGHMGIIQVESKGYDRPGYNKPLNIRPFGSVYVRAQTEAYGASNDCIPGQIAVVNTAVPAGQPNLLFGDVDPNGGDPAVGDLDAPGFYFGGSAGTKQAAVGARGRFGLTFSPLPALASAGLPPAPLPAPAPVASPSFGSKTSFKPSSTGRLTVSLSNPNAAARTYKLSAKTVRKYKVGKSRKVVTVAAAKTVTLKPGASSVKLSLTKAAKALLKAHKSVRVKLTLTPAAGGGAAVTKTITLKR
jgi:hypothetical protein